MDKLATMAPTAPLPLYRRIADELRREIEAGGYAPGAPLPSEHELMRRFGVSRGTIRQARASLRLDGMIAGGQGRRLAVHPPTLTQPLSELISFSAWATSLGKTPSARVIARAIEPADAEAAVSLLVSEGTPLHRVVRLRFADGQPLMIERTLFAPQLDPHLDEIDLENQSIYAELSKRGVELVAARHRISASSASRRDAGLLGIPAGAPLLRVRRLGLGVDGLPLEWSDDCYRGDLVDFAIENSAISSGVVRRFEPGGS